MPLSHHFTQHRDGGDLHEKQAATTPQAESDIRTVSEGSSRAESCEVDVQEGRHNGAGMALSAELDVPKPLEKGSREEHMRRIKRGESPVWIPSLQVRIHP